MGIGSEHLKMLHEDVISAFERIHPLLAGASSLVDNWSKNPGGVPAELGSLSQHLRHVRELELVMPIVAPMKAGKSSLINAIVGYQLLPARANPMTTLPTKIVLVDGMDLASPELEIPASLQKLYTWAEEAIYQAIRAGWPLPDGHSYLKDLATDIANQDLPPLKRTYTGVAAVHAILARLNDQMRMLAFADPNLDLLNEVEDLPVLRTGSLHSYGSGEAMAGRLVIVDTPGPNENAIASRLSQVLERQLTNSHVVLVVLDYTQMGSEAAQDIRDRLSRHLAIITSERLFAVVNKVDARKGPGDLSQEDTYENARNSLNLTSEQAKGRIFETVAHWGVIGSRVVAELASPPEDYDPAASEAVITLWKELRPLDDAEEIAAELSETSAGRIGREARKLLNRSGVATVVGSAISRLRQGAAPMVMAAALDRYLAAQRDLREVLELEHSAAQRGQSVVREQLGNLDKEIALLAAMRAARPDSEALRRRFSGNIEGLITLLRKGGMQLIATLDAQEQADPSLPDQIQAMVRSTFRKVKKAVWRGSEAQETREFPTLTEAEAFMDRMGSSVVTELSQLLDWGRSEANKRIKVLADALVDEQEDQVSEVLKRAAEMLETAFDVKLTVRRVSVDTAVEVSLDRPTAKTSSGTREYTETEYKRTFRRLWIVKGPVQVKKSSSWSTTIYVVSRSDVKTRITTVFEGRLREIRQALMTYLTGELDAKLTDYYDRTDQYLQRYHSALNRSQDASVQDEKDKKERLAKLAALGKALADESRTLDDYRVQLAGYGNANS